MANKKGLTVFEILVAVTIISILSYFSFPKYAMIWKESKKVTMEKELGVLRTGVSIYKIKNGEYPKTLEILEKEGFISFSGELLDEYNIRYKKKDEQGFFLDSFGNRYLYNNKTGEVWIQKRVEITK